MAKYYRLKDRQKNIINFVLLCTIIFLNILCTAQTTTRFVSANLNIRSEPNTHSKILTTIPKNTAVKIEANCNCEWIPIQYDNYTGYVYSKYISKTPVSTSYNKGTENNSTYSGVRYYTNSRGERVQSPTHYSTRPASATALCRDGTYSFSRSRRGTCSHHGGVKVWY